MPQIEFLVSMSITLHTTEKILEKKLRFRVKFCPLSIIYDCNRKTYLT